MLFSFRIMRTTLADYFVREHTSEHILDDSRSISFFHLIFQTIEENIRELVDIHLFSHICRITFIILKGIAEVLWIIKLLITVPQIEEHLLNLKQQVLLFEFRNKCRLYTCSYRVSKVRYHEELLHKRVHIANATEILDANVASGRFHLIQQSNCPVVESLCTPLPCFVQRCDVMACSLHNFGIVADENPKQGKRLSSRGLCFTHT